MANLELPFGIKVLNPKPLDAKYLNDGVPYTSIEEVNLGINLGIRHTGLTVNISGVEYWYALGIDDVDLVIKSSGGSGSGSGERIEKEYTQTNHGFSVGEVISWSGTSFIKAIADGTQNAEVVGFVTDVPDNDNFTVVFSGYIEGIIGLSLDSSSTYFLSATVAGEITKTDVTIANHISKPILTTFTNNDALVFQYREFEITSGTTETANNVFVTTVSDILIPDTSVNSLYVASGTTGYTLTASPVTGAEITFVDELGTASTNNIIIYGNGKIVYDDTFAIINSNNSSITLTYNGYKWNVTGYVF